MRCMRAYLKLLVNRRKLSQETYPTKSVGALDEGPEEDSNTSITDNTLDWVVLDLDSTEGEEINHN